MKRQAGFTLLEVIVALGVLAVGATAAFALLVAGAASGRRAEHEVNAALLAETVIDDLRDDVTIDLDLSDYPRVGALDPNDPATVANPPPQGANPDARYLARNETWSAYPDYRYDLALTALPDPTAPPDGPWRFLAEVEVRWSDQGQRRSAVYATVLVKGVTGRQLPQPPANPRTRRGP